MKKINDDDFLKIDAVKDLDNIQLSEYAPNAWITSFDNKQYLIIKRSFENSTNYIDDKILLEHAKCEIHKLDKLKQNWKLDFNYGDNNSIIVDMNGIDNFRFAKSQVFCDSDVRKIVLKLGAIEKNRNYLRFGCSGSRPSDYHPGGEVFESCLINGSDGSGISQSVSGYLPQNEEFSKSIVLYDKTKRKLRDERIVYSHTAFLGECKIENSNCICISINPTQKQTSLLDIISEISSKLKLSSYAIQIYIETKNTKEYNTVINGRVLKHLPQKPFDVLQDATDIGLEQKFELDDCDVMYAVGTHYKRYEPEWKEFTGGRQYERRGHIHATVVGNSKKQKHEVFHLRDVFVSPVTSIQLVLTPVNDIYRIYPVYQENDKFYCKSTNKGIDDLINEVKKFDSM